jgi:hypothetical protein
MQTKSNIFKKMIIGIVLIPIFLTLIGTAVIYFGQEKIVKQVISKANEDFKGKISINGSHIAFFANFPYISIDLEGVSVYETKDTENHPILFINDLYLGFDLWTIFSGNFEIKSIKLANGDINIVQYGAGDFNIMRAFESYTEKTSDELNEEFHLELKELKLSNLNIDNLYTDSILIDSYFKEATIKFKAIKDHLYLSVDANIELSLLNKGDTTFLNRKPIDIDSKLDYFKENEKLVFLPSKIRIANVNFEMDGQADLANDFDVDIKLEGKKSDFGLLIALAPDDLIPVLRTFENRGDVFFTTTLKGKSVNGHTPFINAEFGCENGYLKNPKSDKILDELRFKGFFTNGENRNAETMRFELNDFHARPETGNFDINLVMENFESPDINIKLTTIFDLDYLSKFLNAEQLRDLSGQVKMEMNFHDIIDLAHPEKNIEKFNESYYTLLDVKNLGFVIPGYDKRIDNININLHVKGNEAVLENFSMKVGGSDISITGTISDLPAVVHHTNIPVISTLSIRSKALDIKELTLANEKSEQVVDEYIRNLELDLKLTSSAKAITEAPYLPYGDFNITKFSAKLTNYPHAIHDFVAHVKIDTSDMSIINLEGFIDQSDFHFKGKLRSYPLWFQEEMTGDTKIEFDLTSSLLQLKDIFAYDGENHVPEDYRDEELRQLKIKGIADLHFNNKNLYAADFYLKELTAKMNIHPMKLDRFEGNFHVEDNQLTITNFKGKIGNTSFVSNINYFLGNDIEQKKKKNYLQLNAPHIDFDQLFAYNSNSSTQTSDHDSVFSIFDVPFPEMKYDVKIGKMNYHKYLIENINAQMSSTPDHMLYIDTLQMDIAGGHLDINGYFSGKNRDSIYFMPNIKMKKVDLDKLMLKFDNFGQDNIVSDNLHGKINGTLSGKIHMHADLIPMLDDSKINIDFLVEGGALEKFAPMQALSGFFEDKKLEKVLFDSLQNNIRLENGIMVIPEMVINSNLGFIVVSGKQDLDMNMEYFIKVPLKLISASASKKLFGKRKESDSEQLYDFDPKKNYRFVNVVVTGNSDDFKVSLSKKN